MTTRTVKCSHHWIMADGRGAVVRGRCRLCGEERMFTNTEVREPRPKRSYKKIWLDQSN